MSLDNKDVSINVELRINTTNTDKAIDIIEVLNEIRNEIPTNNPYKCSVCEKQTTTTIGLQRHQKMIHGEIIDNPIQEEYFKCELCKDTFKTSFDIAIHRRIDHKPENIWG